MPYITTNDGVKLHYIEKGSGKPILMIPGWSQTAALFKYQLEGLSNRYRVIAVDMRGHGESEKVKHGYRISRLAKDVDDIITALDLDAVNLLGHSMGCSVVWNYFDLFGTKRLSKFIFIDEPTWVVLTPDMSPEEKADVGGIVDFNGLQGLYLDLRGPNAAAVVRGFIGGMVTKNISPELLEFIITENLKFPPVEAAEILIHHCCLDWRDVFPRIKIPTLIFGGKVSHVNPQSQVWIHQNTPGSRLEIFEEAEGGAHFMFLEGPQKFNQILAEFIG